MNNVGAVRLLSLRGMLRLEKVGMKEQIFKQLVLSSEGDPLEELLTEWEAMYGEMLEF